MPYVIVSITIIMTGKCLHKMNVLDIEFNVLINNYEGCKWNPTPWYSTK